MHPGEDSDSEDESSNKVQAPVPIVDETENNEPPISQETPENNEPPISQETPENAMKE